MTGPIAIRCMLLRSAFSGERVFRVKQHDGPDYVGVAPVHYCHDSKGHPLDADAPPPGGAIEGLVDARLVSNGGAVAQVSVPTGDTIVIPASEVLREEVSTRRSYVPVGSGH